MIQSNAIKGEKFILEFSEIFPINGTFYNGNIGENNHFILDFPKIFPFNGVPFNGVRLYESVIRAEQKREIFTFSLFLESTPKKRELSRRKMF